MLPYSSGLILDNANNYGIVKTEAVFGFGRHNSNNFVEDVGYNATPPMEWLITPVSLERRSLQVTETPKALKHSVENTTVKPEARHAKKKKAKKQAKKQKRKGKGKKCVFKILKKDKRNRRKGNQNIKPGMKKKFLLPLILGLLAAKSVLIPIALKALAFMSAKGFLMGFFSTILASFLSIKGMFDHTHRYQDRKDEKTQVEIIQVPAKENHYYDDHYRRGDYIPVVPLSEANMNPDRHTYVQNE